MKDLFERMNVWLCGRVDDSLSRRAGESERRGFFSPTPRRPDSPTPKKRPYVHTSILPYLLPALLATVFLAACDSTDAGEFETEYVVEGYLIAGEPFQPIRLSRTTETNQRYDFTALAIRDAAVRVDLLGDDGNVEASYAFREAPDSLGVYFPEDATLLVKPLGTYRLEVTVPSTNDVITATTVVPDTFRLVDATLTEAVYQSTEQLELTVTRSRSPGRDQNYYIFVTESLDPREEQLTPFAKAVFEQEDDEFNDERLDDLRVNGSPILNEDNYDVNPDGTLTIRYPWIAIAFFGPNRLIANALDDNLYDFIRSQSVQQGGSTFAPGEIPNPLERVNGAHGVFGSYARVSFELFVIRPEGF